jgi:hypothetical protein
MNEKQIISIESPLPNCEVNQKNTKRKHFYTSNCGAGATNIYNACFCKRSSKCQSCERIKINDRTPLGFTYCEKQVYDILVGMCDIIKY